MFQPKEVVGLAYRSSNYYMGGNRAKNNINNLRQIFDLLDKLHGDNNLVIFYEEPEYAHMVEYHFIKTGLEKGESCKYTTHEEDIHVIEQDMADFRIDVAKYKISQSRIMKTHICLVSFFRSDILQ